jgi:ribA/ribD-fused uncharacterized protein
MHPMQPVTAAALAAMLTGIEYPANFPKDTLKLAKTSGLVIAYGASDDLLEFAGAFSEEVGANDGTSVFLTQNGLHQNKCDAGDDCPHFKKLPSPLGATIEAVWAPPEMPDTSWLIKTTIPHATFDIMEDGAVFCRGIVFALTDVAPARGDGEQAEPVNPIIAAALKLEARGWFAESTCADAAANADMAEMRHAIDTYRAAIGTSKPLYDNHGLDTDEAVFFYEQDFYPFSSFSAFNVEIWGELFETAEHAYHWKKFDHDGPGAADMQHLIKYSNSAHHAFKLAQENKHLRRPDWDDVKPGYMLDIIRAKTSQHGYVLKKLRDTGDRQIIENSHRDPYWGWGPNRDGQNVLGRLWMQLRNELGVGATKTSA